MAYHHITVFKVYIEIEDPAWCLYDEAHHEIMAATDCRDWKGMDIQLNYGVCGGKLYRRQPGGLNG